MDLRHDLLDGHVPDHQTIGNRRTPKVVADVELELVGIDTLGEQRRGVFRTGRLTANRPQVPSPVATKLQVRWGAAGQLGMSAKRL
jgi:hypothetical protein